MSEFGDMFDNLVFDATGMESKGDFNAGVLEWKSKTKTNWDSSTAKAQKVWLDLFNKACTTMEEFLHMI